MADDVELNVGTGGAKIRSLQDAAGKQWNAAVLSYATTVSPGANVLQVVTATFGLPVALTSAQLATLTPPAAITGFATSALQDTGNTTLSAIAASLAGILNVRPASPTANSYLPVRLSDGTSFYSASVGGGGSGQQYAEDAAHVSGDLGTVALAVRKDTATSLAGADGDYSVLLTDSNGRLHVNPGTVAVTGTFYQATQPVSLSSVPSHPVTNAGTFAVQAAQTGTWTVTGVGGTFPITDSNGSLTVDAPVTTPVFVRLSDGTSAISTLPVSLASVPSHGVTNAGTFAVQAALTAGTATIGAVNFAQALDLTNDRVGVRVISGTLDDGAGVALAVKTALGTSSASGVNAALAAVAGKRIRVLSYSLQAANANGSVVAANWQDDAGTPVVLSQAWELAAREGISKPLSTGPGFYFQTTSGQALKLNLGSALAVRWEVVYVEA